MDQTNISVTTNLTADSHSSPLKVLFLGSKNLGLKMLSTLVDIAPNALVAALTFDDTKDKRSALNEFNLYCDKQGVELKILGRLDELESILNEYKAELLFVCGWYSKIPQKILGRFSHGVVGLHASLLPLYRGHAPLVWTLYHGLSMGGLSLFYFEEGFDTGDILNQKQFPLGPDTPIFEALNLVEQNMVQALIETYPLLLQGKAPRQKQNHRDATYCLQRKPEDGILDWNFSATQIHNAIRAQTHPYPGAFTYLNGRKLTLWKSARTQAGNHEKPGTIMGANEDCILVACGEGAIQILEVQFEDEDEASFPLSKFLKMGMSLGK